MHIMHSDAGLCMSKPSRHNRIKELIGKRGDLHQEICATSCGARASCEPGNALRDLRELGW